MPDLHIPEMEATAETPLESWKEIATYLNRDVSTVKRWEKEEGLPIRRHMHQSRASVYAYPTELDAWRVARKPLTEIVQKPWARPLRALATAAALIMPLFLAGDPGVPSAHATEQGADVTLRRVWSGDQVDSMGSPSADGKRLTFVDWSTGDLAIRDLTTGKNRRLTDKGTWTQANQWAEYSVFSPDEKRIAYAWYDKQYELRVMGADGTGTRTLYRSDDLTYVTPSAWTPDGAHVLCVFSRRNRTNDIALVNANDGTLRVLKTLDWRSPGRVSLSPDGRYIAYSFQLAQEARARDIFNLRRWEPGSSGRGAPCG